MSEQAEPICDPPDAPSWVQSVAPATIDAQRAARWPDFHPENFCHRCGQRNPPWFTPNWDEAGLGHGGILCPGCFVLVADPDGRYKTWALRPFTYGYEAAEASRLAELLRFVSDLGEDAERVAGCILNAGWAYDAGADQ